MTVFKQFKENRAGNGIGYIAKNPERFFACDFFKVDSEKISLYNRKFRVLVTDE